MPHHPYESVAGTIAHVSAHRFVLRTGEGVVLADLTTEGTQSIALLHRPTHFELLRQGQGRLKELHVELNGDIRKSKQVAKVDHKGSAELRDAS
jgi:hypothetical protein